MTAVPRLLIADRGPTRFGVRLALQGAVLVCAEAASAEEAIRLAKQTQPDVCLIGWEIAGGGSAAVRGVTRAAPATRVIVLADDPSADAMLDAVRLGAVGFIHSALSPEQLQKVVGAVIAREAVLPRSMILDLLLELRSAGAEVDGLTGREAQVLGLLRRGHSTATIARRLDIAPVTVRRHISELVRKFGVLDRSELVSANVA
jgi:two-component system, NarL family, nitrate/nitrite response regulator NarL